MSLIRITDLVHQLGISSRSLRYYEQVGLIHSVRPPLEKYRYYDADTVQRLKQILVLRKMQIPVRDILRIYDSQDMSVVVETFVHRIREIDEEIDALSELKRIVNEFLQTMAQNGITHICALPLLYEELDKHMNLREERKPVSYGELAAVSEQLAPVPSVGIVSLPPMRMLTSRRKEDGAADAEGFWDWLAKAGIPMGGPGQRALFEYQAAGGQTVLLQRVDDGFANDSPFADERFEGGLFAAAGVYVDEDLGAFHRAMVRGFDDSPYYEVDYRHDGRLRHETLVESLLSPDGKRERVDILLPVRPRLPDASLYGPNQPVEGIAAGEILQANPALWTQNVAMDRLIPILDPYYRVNEQGEAEFIPYIDKRQLSTGVPVTVPFRVDIEFRVDDVNARFAYGSDEGSIRFYHGSHLFGINMDSSPDQRLSKEAICFHQPVFGDFFRYPGRGGLLPGVYHRLSWVVGPRHFAVIVDDEVRYCGVDFPYMAADLRLQSPQPIVLGSGGSNKILFRSVAVSQLRQAPKLRIKEGDLTVTTKQSNNRIPNIHQLVTLHHGENYWFNGAAKYVMECLGEPHYDYQFFAGLTGDVLAQVFARDHFRGDGVTDYRMGDGVKGAFVEGIFDACGYASTFVPERSLRANREMYLQTLMAYIDKGVPVIRYLYGWGVFVGYEEYGKTLLYLSADKPEPERVSCDALFTSQHPAFQDRTPAQAEELADTMGLGWCFVGERKRPVALDRLYRDVILGIPRLLTTQTEGYCFGPEAFRTWAAQIEGGRFDGMQPEAFDVWAMHTIYVCNAATNGSCCHEFLERAQQHNPDMTFLEEVRKQYRQMAHLWNDCPGEDLEALGGGFNVTLGALQDPDRRGKLAATIRKMAVCMDSVLALLPTGKQ